MREYCVYCGQKTEISSKEHIRRKLKGITTLAEVKNFFASAIFI